MDSALEELAVLGEGRSDSISQSWTRLGPSGKGPWRDLECQVGKPGRLPIVRHRCEMSVALEVVKMNYYYYF